MNLESDEMHQFVLRIEREEKEASGEIYLIMEHQHTIEIS
jgi:hypothetical protein